MRTGTRATLPGRAVLVSIALSTALSCSASILVTGNTFSVGDWGGTGAVLHITVNSVTAEFDCAHGTLPSPMLFDRNGRFEVSGFYFRDIGPVPVGGSTQYAARYTGTVDGRVMALSVTVPDLNVNAGPFILVLGQAPRLVRCF